MTSKRRLLTRAACLEPAETAALSIRYERCARLAQELAAARAAFEAASAAVCKRYGLGPADSIDLTAGGAILRNVNGARPAAPGAGA